MKIENSSSRPRCGIGFIGMLTILFIGLKLTNYIQWSWVWVLSPIWIMAMIVFLIIGIAAWGEASK